jgi:A/G-specific adenine glycosylase
MVAVTEILLQQTAAATVAKHWDGFFASFPSPAALLQAPPRQLHEHLAPLGLATQRERRLRTLAAWLLEHDHLPRERDDLERVPGIGQYVASAIMATCYDEPEPLLDVNMARVLDRFFGPRQLADIRDDPWLQELARAVCPGARLGWAVLDFAALVCRPRRPRCQGCPMRSGCTFTGEERECR